VKREPVHTPLPFEREHPRALALYCSDGRFTESVRELLLRLGHDRLDTLTIPGGAAALNYLLVKGAATFLITGHRIERVVLIAHADCGHYKARFRGRPAEELEVRQRTDLQTAARMLLRAHATLAMDAFFARPDAEGVLFEPVELA
jgi:carbonic anhydrase